LRIAGRGVIWSSAAPTLALSLLLLLTIAVAGRSLIHVQSEADRAIEQALTAADAAERIEQVFQECRSRLGDYAITGRSSEIEQAKRFDKENAERLLQIETLDVSIRGHVLIAELRQYTIALEGALDKIPATAPVETRDEFVERLISTLLDPQILSRAREERELCVQALQAARTRGAETTSRAGWALLILGLVGVVGGTLAGFGIARSLRRELIELSVPIRSAIGSLDGVVGPVQVFSTDNFNGLDAALDSIARRVAQVVERLQEAERERIRNDQMAALGQLAAGLAHELRNPLTAMKTIVDAARRGGPSESMDHRDLAVLKEEIARLDTSLQSFLDYARPPRIAKCPVDLGAIVEKTRQLLAGRAEQQSIRIAIEQPNGPVVIDADAEQLRQVLLNLMLNALDAIGHDGELSVRVDPGADGEAVITVADSGSGISRAVRERLFEPFVSTKESGTGLGLTICRRIVEDHGGRIDASDGPSGGAIFTVRLPTGGTSDAHAPDRR
jgi:two-component system, NtrC family, sensor histidine kinase HydH